MKKLIMAGLLACMVLAGCGESNVSESVDDETYQSSSNYVDFVVVESGKTADGNKYRIVADRMENVLYYQERHMTYYGNPVWVMTPLLRADGTPKPYITE